MALEVLVVDDEADIRELVSGVLEDEGFAVRTAGDSTTARSRPSTATTSSTVPTSDPAVARKASTLRVATCSKQ